MDVQLDHEVAAISKNNKIELCDHVTLGAYFISIEFFHNPAD